MRQREQEEQGTLSCALNFDALVFVLVVVIILGLRGIGQSSDARAVARDSQNMSQNMSQDMHKNT